MCGLGGLHRMRGQLCLGWVGMELQIGKGEMGSMGDWAERVKRIFGAADLNLKQRFEPFPKNKSLEFDSSKFEF